MAVAANATCPRCGTTFKIPWQPEETSPQPVDRSSRRRTIWTITLLVLGIVAAMASPTMTKNLMFGPSQMHVSMNEQYGPMVGESGVELLRNCLKKPQEAFFLKTTAYVDGPVWRASGLVKLKDKYDQEVTLPWSVVLQAIYSDGQEAIPVTISIEGETLFDRDEGQSIRMYPQ